MDVLDTLRSKIESLPEGHHVAGLRAVLLHIQTAFNHLSRGQSTGDETAFTDAIYRTNQAFEGSIKEAYRVLADKVPDKTTPSKIEQYLEQEKVLRPRVLAQFSNYRTQWRNPSTHDYKLDFDEDEALFAIIAVWVFACVLTDQIGAKLAFNASKSETEHSKTGLKDTIVRSASLLETTAELLREFSKRQKEDHEAGKQPLFRTEAQLVSAIAGFMTTVAPELSVDIDVTFEDPGFHVDLLVLHEGQRVIVEVKRGHADPEAGKAQLERYVDALEDGEPPHSWDAILLLYPETGGSLLAHRFVWTNHLGNLIILRACPERLRPVRCQDL